VGSLAWMGTVGRLGLGIVAVSLADLADSDVEDCRSLVWGILVCSLSWNQFASNPVAASHRLTSLAFCIFHSLPCSRQIHLQRRYRHHSLDVLGMGLCQSEGSDELAGVAGVAEELAAQSKLAADSVACTVLIQWFLAENIYQPRFLSLPEPLQICHFRMGKLGPMRLLLSWAE